MRLVGVKQPPFAPQHSQGALQRTGEMCFRRRCFWMGEDIFGKMGGSNLKKRYRNSMIDKWIWWFIGDSWWMMIYWYILVIVGVHDLVNTMRLLFSSGWVNDDTWFNICSTYTTQLARGFWSKWKLFWRGIQLLIFTFHCYHDIIAIFSHPKIQLAARWCWDRLMSTSEQPQPQFHRRPKSRKKNFQRQVCIKNGYTSLQNKRKTPHTTSI